MRSKFGNKKATVDGIKFDSTKEANYYRILKERLEDGQIENLRMQVKYEIIPGVYDKVEEVKHLKRGDKIVCKTCTVQKPTFYVADFVYFDKVTGKEEVVDVKSAITRKHPVYVLKKKMMFAFNGIKITEV